MNRKCGFYVDLMNGSIDFEYCRFADSLSLQTKEFIREFDIAIIFSDMILKTLCESNKDLSEYGIKRSILGVEELIILKNVK